MIGNIAPLVEVTSTLGPKDYVVICRDCGDVTYEESGFMQASAPIVQAGLYQQRHLARHLTALATEIQRATR